jgi:hypothetical protein
MNSRRLHTVLLGLLGLMIIGLAGGAYGVNSLLAKESDKLTGLKAKSQALNQEEIGLKKAKQDIAKYSDLEKITRAVVPEDKNQAEAVRELVNIAAANGISLESVTFPASTLGSTPAGTTAKPAAPATPSLSAGAGAKSLSQLVPVKNISGVYQLVITVDSDQAQPIAYNKLISFLSQLEHNRRTAQVSSIALVPDNNTRSLLTFKLGLTEYIKP